MRRKISTPPKQQKKKSSPEPPATPPRRSAPLPRKDGEAKPKAPIVVGKSSNWKLPALGVTVVVILLLMVLRSQQEEATTENEPIIQQPDSNGDILWKPRIVTTSESYATLELPSSASSDDDSDDDDEKRTRILLSKRSVLAQEHILDSDEYEKKPEPLYTEDPPCEPQYEWMTIAHPVCNILHQVDMTDMLLPEGGEGDVEKFRFLASGGYRDVYMIRDSNNIWDHKLALKTLKSSRDFEERHFDRHKRDAMAADRLTSTKSSVDIYGYCGQSALYEFAKGGNLRTAINKHITGAYRNPEVAWNSTQKLHVAYMVATGIADMHNVDQEGRASIAHTDISTDQFISIEGDGYFQLNDFNRARFLKRNTDDNTNCPFFVKSNKGKFRSPEEYLYQPETEAVDTYSMGNIFFVLLTGTYPFPDNTKKEVKKLVAQGERPEIDGYLLDSPDPNLQALIEAAKMCWVQDPTKRATSRQVQRFLESKLSSN